MEEEEEEERVDGRARSPTDRRNGRLRQPHPQRRNHPQQQKQQKQQQQQQQQQRQQHHFRPHRISNSTKLGGFFILAFLSTLMASQGEFCWT